MKIQSLGIVLGLMLGLSACSTHQTPIAHQPHWASVIKKDANLYRVDDKLYRSEQLIADDVSDIHDQNIKTIINLRYFDRDDDRAIFDGQRVNLVNEPLLTWQVRSADIARVLYAIERGQDKGAVLVHCYHGADRTGIIIAMYRIIYQNWTIQDARQEMQQGDFGYHSVWKNLERLLDPVHVAQVKAHLQRLRVSR